MTERLPFLDAPTESSQCPKCLERSGWGVQYDEFMHPTGYVSAVDTRKHGEHLCWSCRSCGFVVMTETADAKERKEAIA